MTGTLDCLSAVQNDLLKQFGFKVRTRLPSTFKKGVLNEKEKPEDVSTVVEVGSYDEYFETLKREIEGQVPSILSFYAHAMRCLVTVSTIVLRILRC